MVTAYPASGAATSYPLLPDHYLRATHLLLLTIVAHKRIASGDTARLQLMTAAS